MISFSKSLRVFVYVQHQYRIRLFNGPYNFIFFVTLLCLEFNSITWNLLLLMLLLVLLKNARYATALCLFRLPFLVLQWMQNKKNSIIENSANDIFNKHICTNVCYIHTHTHTPTYHIKSFECHMLSMGTIIKFEHMSKFRKVHKLLWKICTKKNCNDVG